MHPIGCSARSTPGAVATSGSYERGDHVLDPSNGKPAAAAISATVWGPDLAFADAFATGLLAAGEAGFADIIHAGYHALIVAPDRTVTHTTGFLFARVTSDQPCTAG